MAIGLMIMAYV